MLNKNTNLNLFVTDLDVSPRSVQTRPKTPAVPPPNLVQSPEYQRTKLL